MIYRYASHDEYLEFLKTVPVSNPFEREQQKKWKYLLESQLENTHEIAYLQMPNPRNATYQEWKIWFERHFEFMNDDIILIGNSLGGWFLAKYLSEAVDGMDGKPGSKVLL